MKKTIYILLIISPIFSFAQDFVAPQSFSHLTMIRVLEKSNAFLFITSNSNLKISEISKPVDVFEEEHMKFLCLTEITKNEKFLIGFSEGPSADPYYEFFKLIDGEYIATFVIEGLQLYIPGNGNIYVSGHSNSMFNSRKKYKFSNDSITEIKQPYQFVGLQTTTNKSIQIFSDQDREIILATLPPKSEIEVVACEISPDYNDYWFLIKSSFGLLGWWKLDDFYSETIEGLYYHGD